MMQLWEDAAIIDIRVYAFGLYAAAGTALGLTVLAFLLRRNHWKQGSAAVTGALAILCGFVLSRLLFSFLDNNLGGPLTLKGMLLVTGGGYSMMGALLGACLGALLAARITGQNAARLLDYLAPALMLFIAFERLGEGCVEEFGISRPLVGDLFKGTFLAWEAPNGEYYLYTYLLEAMTAGVLLIVLLLDERKTRRPGDTFLLFMLLFGASQVVLESLRFDAHMYWSFVGWQQIIAFMILIAGVATLALRRIRDRRWLAIAALIALALSLGASIWLEFIIARTEINRYLLYAAFIIAVSAPAVLGILLRKERKA